VREPTDDFSPIEIAFLCWARMHATGAAHEDVELANRLNDRADLIARTRAAKLLTWALSKAE
jgi:hypothetical protein